MEEVTGQGWKVTPLGLQEFKDPPFTTRNKIYSYACDVYFARSGKTFRIQSWRKGYTQEQNLSDAIIFARANANPKDERRKQ